MVVVAWGDEATLAHFTYIGLNWVSGALVGVGGFRLHCCRGGEARREGEARGGGT